jgi:hypothetical protein
LPPIAAEGKTNYYHILQVQLKISTILKFSIAAKPAAFTSVFSFSLSRLTPDAGLLSLACTGPGLLQCLVSGNRQPGLFKVFRFLTQAFRSGRRQSARSFTARK